MVRGECTGEELQGQGGGAQRAGNDGREAGKMEGADLGRFWCTA